jgi:RecJ-like exonuclease
MSDRIYCTYCHGQGIIFMHSTGARVDCPRCDGTGTHNAVLRINGVARRANLAHAQMAKRELVVYFNKELSDDDMRRFHEFVRNFK